MVLARCCLNGRVFQCDVTLVGSKLVVYDLTSNAIIEVGVYDVKDVDYIGSELTLVLTTGKKIVVSALEPMSSTISYIGKTLELRVKLPIIASALRTLLPALSRLMTSLLNVLITLGSNYPAGWMQLKSVPNELTLMNMELAGYGIDLDEHVRDLSRVINTKNVGMLKDLTRRIILEAVSSGRKFLKSLLVFEDLSSLADILVLAHAVNLAYSINQTLDAERTLAELGNVCYVNIYTKILERTGVNLCDVLVRSLKEVGIERAFDEFLNMLISLLNERYA